MAIPEPTWPPSGATTAKWTSAAKCPHKRKLPCPLRRNSASVYDPAHDSIKVITLHIHEGLEFPVVELVGAGRMPAEGEDEREDARLFFAGATQRLVIGLSVGGQFVNRFAV